MSAPPPRWLHRVRSAPSRADIAELLQKNEQWLRPVQVAILFGTGAEVCRHGVRAFVDRSLWRMIINVPAVEPIYPWASRQRWGIGISDDQVRQLVRACFGQNLDFVVDRLISFRTGYIGVSGTMSPLNKDSVSFPIWVCGS